MKLVPSGKKNVLPFRDRKMVLEVLCNNMPRPMKRDPTTDHGWGYTRMAGKCHAHIVVCCVPPENMTVEVSYRHIAMHMCYFACVFRKSLWP